MGYDAVCKSRIEHIYANATMAEQGGGSCGLEWVVESTTVTHSSADWWDILLPRPCHGIANRHHYQNADRRGRRFFVSPKDTGKAG